MSQRPSLLDGVESDEPSDHDDGAGRPVGADPAAGGNDPQAEFDIVGEDDVPEPYIRADYDYARSHKWYGAARMITVNDVYSFDPDAVVRLEDFTDIVGRYFRQPKEGLGFDNSPVAHMWRTKIWPRNFL